MKGIMALCEISPGIVSPGLFIRILGPELKSEIVGQGVSAGTKDGAVFLRIRCDDIPGMRASLNSYLHWFHTIKGVESHIIER